MRWKEEGVQWPGEAGVPREAISAIRVPVPHPEIPPADRLPFLRDMDIYLEIAAAGPMI